MEPLFKSFFIGGYECADHVNRSGDRINLLVETGHDFRVCEDYLLLSKIGINTVREGICWSKVETEPFQYDFSEVINRIKAAEELGMQQIWDICHFGFPDDLCPTHPKFTKRFEALCEAFLEVYKHNTNKPLLVIPINEISFLSWHAGDVRGTIPFAINSGFDIKYHLCKAAIAAIKVMKMHDATCKVFIAEPLIRIHAPHGEDMTLEIKQHNENQFQAIDIITGRLCSELGGCEDLIDVIGCNYYYNNQWEHGGQLAIWPEFDERRIRLSRMLDEVQQRYNKPLFIAETGHFGEGRAQWLKEVFDDIIGAMEVGLNILGLCLYPIIDRPDWDNLQWYHNSGMWDINSATKVRFPNQPYLDMLKECNARLIGESPVARLALQSDFKDHQLVVFK